jgi:hypothetical protein
MSLVKSIHIQARSPSDIGPQPKDAFTVLYNLAPAELAVPIDPVHEGDRNFPDVVSERSGTCDHFHLEHVSFGLRDRDDVAQYGKSVESNNRFAEVNIWERPSRPPRIERT